MSYYGHVYGEVCVAEWTLMFLLELRACCGFKEIICLSAA